MIIILNMYENNERTAQNPMVFCHFFHENCMSFNFWNNRIGGSLILNLFFSINWKFFHVKFSKARAQGLPAKWNTCTTLVYKYVSCDICKCATKKKWIQLSLAIYVNVTLRKNGFNSLSLSLSLSLSHIDTNAWSIVKKYNIALSVDATYFYINVDQTIIGQ